MASTPCRRRDVAKADRHEEVTEVRVIEPERVTLALTREEAETLAVATFGTTGHPRDSARRHFDCIGAALRSVGIDPGQYSLDARYKVDQRLAFSPAESAIEDDDDSCPCGCED